MKQTSKARGDIAEYRVVAELLELGHSVLMPCGDRLPYDVAVDVSGELIRIQVEGHGREQLAADTWLIPGDL